MKKIIQKLYPFIYFLIIISFSRCAELIDCIASARPDIKSKNLIVGYIGSNYNDFIDSEVTNEINDNNYNYYFSLSGNLPPGVSFYTQGRRIILTGNPIATGIYTFTVTLTVDPFEYYNPNQSFFEDGNRICFGDDTTSKDFKITIQ